MPTVVSLLPREKFYSADPAVPEDWDIVFLDTYSEEAVIRACKQADCLFTPHSAGPVTADILQHIPHIRLVQTMGVGVDHIDLAAAADMGIPVANNPNANATAVAEHTIGLLIALQRRLVESDAAVKSGRYQEFRDQLLREGLHEVRGSRIGLVGFGNIGRQVAAIARVMGAEISYYTRRRKTPEEEKMYGAAYKALDELLSDSDVISLHLPLNSKTRHLIGRRELERMPKGSLLINAARGGIVDQEALIEAVASGHLAGAALDTFDPEPLGPDHPLLHLPEQVRDRMIFSPHTAGVTLGAYKRMIEDAFANMKRAVRGEPPQHVVNNVSSAVV